LTPLAIDPETLQLAAQCLNHYATPGLELSCKSSNFRKRVMKVIKEVK
jgi:hypothetical protein